MLNDKVIGKWLNRLHFKTRWKMYIDDEISYGEYKEYVETTVRSIREILGLEFMDAHNFDTGWQYRNVASENYKDTYSELVRLISWDW